MAGKGNSRRWILIALIVIGVAVIAMLPRGATDDGERDSDESTSSSTEAATGSTPAARQGQDSGLATKRVMEGCDPIAEARKYEEFVDKRALAILRWNNMSARATKLKIPIYVHGVDDGAIAVGILPIPMRVQYLNIWMTSGHIERGPDDTFLLDPCASWIETWEEMEGPAEDE